LGDFPAFQESFDKYVKSESVEYNIKDETFSPHVKIDHLLKGDELSLLNSRNILDQIERLAPYGQKFEEPIFAINGRFESSKSFGLGDNYNAHLELKLKDSLGVIRRAVVFHYARQPWIEELAVGEQYTFAVSLSYDDFHKCVGMQIISLSSGVNEIGKPL